MLPVPIKPVELELELLPVPIRPVELELELLDELLLEELLLDELLLEELLFPLPVPVPLFPVVLLVPAVEEEALELLADACPLLPWPFDPPLYIASAKASSDGKVTPSTRSSTSMGLESANTNSFLPL